MFQPFFYLGHRCFADSFVLVVIIKLQGCLLTLPIVVVLVLVAELVTIEVTSSQKTVVSLHLRTYQ